MIGSKITFGKKGDVNAPTASAFPVTVETRSIICNEINSALKAIDDKFWTKSGEHLFGPDCVIPYTGSTSSLMDSTIPDVEFVTYKPIVGDIDVQVSLKHKDDLVNCIDVNDQYDKFIVVGIKKHGNETSIGLKHIDSCHIYQIDFEGVDNPGSDTDVFLHSSNWEDTKLGIKGAHHKVLLNAIGCDEYKFSITHGLRSRVDESDQGVMDPIGICNTLFGMNSVHSKIYSFIGLVDLIKTHKTPEEQTKIYDKFEDSVSKLKRLDSKSALDYMTKHLDLEHHAHISFMGASPITHMGHYIDVIEPMGNTGLKFVGLSGKSDVFSDDEREQISNAQSGGSVQFKVEKTAGQTIGRAFKALKDAGKKILHLHFGADRKQFAERLKDCIEAGKIPELEGQVPNKIYIHYPENETRPHGFSGTRMRMAAMEGDFETFKHHLGSNFSYDDIIRIMTKTKFGIESGKIKLNRR